MYPGRDAERSEHVLNDARQRVAGKAIAPIGVFDSGAGGLTILSALRQELPQEDYIYVGDTAHCPYGVRTNADITKLTMNACRFLLQQGVKLIVIACNTASQAALNALRATFDVPFVGVVPAVKPAARATKRGHIGVAATNQAVKAAYLHHLIEDFAAGVQVYAVGCPELVTLVEHGELDGPVVEETLQHVLHPLLSKNIDVLVLGCTHFPAMRSAIEQTVGKNVLVIDSGAAVARRTRAVLDTESLVRPLVADARAGTLTITCSGDPEAFSRVASKVLGYPVVAHRVSL
ncbi:MAG: glutamate racemase [Ktedonobacteraceae bacterium]